MFPTLGACRIYRNLSDLARLYVGARLNALGRPVSVILAERSRYHDPERVHEAILEVVPAAHVATIAGASHHMLPLQPAPHVDNAIVAALGV